MGKRSLLAVALILLLAAGSLYAADGSSRLMRYPDIHGNTIVFSYGGDLWTVPADGGVATRLTTHPGGELFPKFSPDGKTIAFTGSYDGNSDVFTIPSDGGEPERLTYHSFGDMVINWHPSGDKVLFRSARESKTNPGPRYNRLFTIDSKGGYPRVLPLFEGELSSYSPDGTRLAYNRISREFRTWKRYRGGMAQNIWLYDLEKNEAEQLTEFEGTDAFPMWYQNRIYFISDRTHAMNIFCLDLDTREIRQITGHKELDVKWPSLGRESIVYENDGYLYVLDLQTEESERIDITVPSDHILRRPEYKGVQQHIRYFSVSGAGKRAAFGARGEIFTVPAEKGGVRNLSRTSGVRERSPAFSPDGNRIAYLSDRSGEYEIYLRKPDGSGEEKRLTRGLGGYPWQLMWSPDSKKLLVHDETYKFYLVDAEDGDIREIDQDPLTDISDYTWSFDSHWIAYSKNNRNGFSSIYLYSLDKDKSYKVTGDMFDDHGPVFGSEGKYLFFISNRAMNFGFNSFESGINFTQPSTICAATLREDVPSLLEPESDEVKVKEEKEETEKEENGGDEKEEEEKALEIETEGLSGRIIALPVGSGNFIGLHPLEGKLLYVDYSVQPISFSQGPPPPPATAIKYYDLKERETETVITGITGYEVSADGKKLMYASRGTYGIIDIAPGKNVGDDRLDISGMVARIDPVKEWKQIFYEAWRLERNFFYVDNMHGVDWDRMKKRYEKFLPYLTSRADLNYIIGEMIAELNVGHAYVGGGDYPDVDRVGGGKLGCDFQLDEKSGKYRIARIYQGRNWDSMFEAPLHQPGIDINEGEYLLEINGTTLEYPVNPHQLLVNRAGKQTLIKVSQDPDGDEAREYTVVPVANDINLRYAHWVESNRQKVLEASGGKIGYIHVPSTAVTGIVEFGRQFYPQSDMKGIIVDVRYNSGGWMPSMFIDRLDRELTSLWATRYGMVRRFPSTAPIGHMACVINAYAGSGGDAFPYMFRQAGLGPLIGKRTWGGLVGMNRNIPLADGGMTTVPTIGFMNLEGEYTVENKGVAPDIEVDNRPDLVVEGKDPQLERAIRYLMKKIEEEPPKARWEKPDDPDKS